MAFVIADRVRETTSTAGTGSLTLGGPFSGFQGFSVIGDGNNTYYAISDPNTGAWEVGIGTYTASGNVLSRDTVLASSNSGNLVVFAAGTKDVICTQPAERNVYAVGTDVVAANSAKVPNSLLANSSVTLGSTNVALGATATTLSGLTSVAATNFTGAFDGVLGGVTPAAATVTVLTASQDSAFTSTGALTLPVGTTAQRPAAAVGKVRWNTSLNQYEGYDGTNWTLLGGAVISNDTSTATDVYPVFAGVTSGNVSTLFTGNAKLLYKPSTGELQSTALVASNGIVVNSKTVTTNYTIPGTKNAMSTGPVTINDGVTVTVSDGARYVII